MEQIINHLDNNNLGELATRTIGRIMYDLREELDVDIKYDRFLWGYKINLPAGRYHDPLGSVLIKGVTGFYPKV